MSDQDTEYKQLIQSRQSQQFVNENAEALSGVPIRLEASIPSKEPTPDIPGGVRSNAEIDAILAQQRKGQPTPAQEALQTPGGNAVSEGLQAVGQAGKAGMKAISPALDAAGKAIGLELPQGGMEKAVNGVVGLPSQEMSDTEAGVATGLAAIPGVSMVTKLSRPFKAIEHLYPTEQHAFKNASAAEKTRLTDLARSRYAEEIKTELEFLPGRTKNIDAKKVTQLAEESANDLYTRGGSTYNLVKGNMYPQPAYAVAVMPEARAYVQGHATKKDIENYVKSLEGKVDLNSEHINVGTWFDKSTGQTEMSVSLTLNTLDDALAVAKTTGEKSIYSLGSGQEIFTGAKGQSGKANVTAAMTLASAMVGGAFGYKVGEDDNKTLATLTGVGLGALAPLAIPLAKSMARSVLSKTPGLGKAALTKEEMATPWAQITKDYRTRTEAFQRGVRPHKLAREEGARKLASGEISDEYLLTRFPGATYNDAEKAALDEILTQELTKLQALAKQHMAFPGDPLIHQEFDRQYATVAHIDPIHFGAGVEAGRSLSYQNDIENEINAYVSQMRGILGKVRVTQSSQRRAEMVAEAKSLEQISDLTRRTTAPGMTDMLAESWINGLLSQPITHVTNTTSNLLTILTSIPERAVAQGFGAITPGPAGVVAGETSALIRGYMESSRLAWLTAAKAFHQDAPIFGAQKMETRTSSINQKNFELMLQRRFGVDPIMSSWTKAFDYIGTAARVPGRLLLAEDEFFKAIAYGGEASAQAWRAAALDVGSTGITGKALRDGINARYNAIMADPTLLSAYYHDAEQFASYMTFTKDLGEVGQNLQRIAQHPLGRFIAPFIRTPINIAKYAGERTPFALLSANVRDDIAKGGATRDLALAKLAAGSSTMALFAGFAAAGVVTGFGPADKEARALWQTDGRKPYSININGLKRFATGGDPSPQTGDQWITYSRIDPIGMLIGLSADTTDILMNQDDPEVADHLGARLTLVASHVIASKTYVKGVAEWAFAAADPEHYVGKLEESLARTAVTTIPAVGPLAKLTQRAIDPVVRETNGVMDAIKSTIPNWSSTLPPKRNYWGEVSLKEGWQVGGVGIENILSPLYRSTALKDDVVKRLVESQVNLTPPRDTIGKVKLNPQQYDYLREQFGTVLAGGQNVHQAYEDILSKYPHNTTDSQSVLHLLLKQREDVYKNLAREALYKKYPTLRDATGRVTAEEKTKSLHIPPPPRGLKEITVE